MSTTIHSVIIEPGVTMTYVCVDGLSPLVKHKVAELLVFNGHLKAVDCGAGEEWVTLNQAYLDMTDLAHTTPEGDERKDYLKALDENYEAFLEF